MNDKLIKQARLFFILGITLVILAPFIFTRSGFIDFSNTGQIGDTIGGITAPIANLIGSILIFYALQAQIEANRIIQDQIKSQTNSEIKKKNIQNLFDQFKILREDINEFTYITSVKDNNGKVTNTTYLTRTGFDAFRQVIIGMKQFKSETHGNVYDVNPKLVEIKNILMVVDKLVDKVVAVEADEVDKVFLVNLISYQFNSKVMPAFSGMENYKLSKQKNCEYCGNKHSGIPDELFGLINSIHTKLISG